MTRGKFITLEGGEGAGKSTQAGILADALAARGIGVLRTREPGGAPGAELLRKLLLDGDIAWSPAAETLLHFAARSEHVARSIRPALDAGMWVVCDRFADSTMAYQGWGQGADRRQIAALTAMLEVQPDLTLVLDVPVGVSLDRLTRRGTIADRYERLGAGFFARIRDGFQAIADAEPARCVLIEAQSGQDAVAARIFHTVASRLGLLDTSPLPAGAK